MGKLNNVLVNLCSFVLLNLHTILFIIGLTIIVTTAIVVNKIVGFFILGAVLILLAFMLNGAK